MSKKETRTLKVYGQSGYRYQDTPAIILKGKWLEDKPSSTKQAE